MKLRSWGRAALLAASLSHTTLSVAATPVEQRAPAQANSSALALPGNISMQRICLQGFRMDHWQDRFDTVSEKLRVADRFYTSMTPIFKRDPNRFTQYVGAGIDKLYWLGMSGQIQSSEFRETLSALREADASVAANPGYNLFEANRGRIQVACADAYISRLMGEPSSALKGRFDRANAIWASTYKGEAPLAYTIELGAMALALSEDALAQGRPQDALAIIRTPLLQWYLDNATLGQEKRTKLGQYISSFYLLGIGTPVDQKEAARTLERCATDPCKVDAAILRVATGGDRQAALATISTAIRNNELFVRNSPERFAWVAPAKAAYQRISGQQWTSGGSGILQDLIVLTVGLAAATVVFCAQHAGACASSGSAAKSNTSDDWLEKQMAQNRCLAQASRWGAIGSDLGAAASSFC